MRTRKPFGKARAYHRRIFIRYVDGNGLTIERTILRRFPDGHFDYEQFVRKGPQ